MDGHIAERLAGDGDLILQDDAVLIGICAGSEGGGDFWRVREVLVERIDDEEQVERGQCTIASDIAVGFGGTFRS